MASNENLVLQSIGEYLTWKKHFFWRANTTPIYDASRKVYRSMPKFSKRGVPDLIVIKDGQFIGLEVKDKSPQSKDQKTFEKECKENGCRYYLVRSIDDVKKTGL